MKLWVFMVILMAFVSNVNALDTNIDIRLMSSGKSQEVITVEFTADEDLSGVDYSLLNKPDNLVVYDEKGDIVDFELIENELFDIILEKEIIAGESYQLRFEFEIEGLIEELEDKNVFSFRFLPADIVESFKLEVMLPRGYVLAELESAVSPAGYDISTDGKDILITWEFEKVDDEQSFIILYERGLKSGSVLLVFLVVVVAIVWTLVGVSWYYKREKKQIIDGVLSNDEKQIMKLIEDNKEITQKQVVKDLGYSKAKISKLIRRLEEKGLVVKTPWMATNKLKIKNKIRR